MRPYIAVLSIVMLAILGAGSPVLSQDASNCSLASLAGTYSSNYGDLNCDVAGQGLYCCYYQSGNECRKFLELNKQPGTSKLTGQWTEGRSTGSAEFTINVDCTLGDGLWGNDTPTSAWFVTGRIGEPQPLPGAAELTVAPEPKRSVVDDRIAEIEALPPTTDSLNQLAVWMYQGKQKRLSNDRRDYGVGNLSRKEREELAVRVKEAGDNKLQQIIEGLASEWDRFPNTIAGLKDIERIANEQGRALQAPAGEITDFIGMGNAMGSGNVAEPTNINSLMEMFTSQVDASSIYELQNTQVALMHLYPIALERFNVVYREKMSVRARQVWPQAVAELEAATRSTATSTLEGYKVLADAWAATDFVNSLNALPATDALYPRYMDARQAARNRLAGMVDNSSDEVIAWMTNLEASASANRLLDEFTKELFGNFGISDRYPEIHQASREKRREFHPRAMYHPELIVSVIRGHWRDIDFEGISGLAYYWTTMRKIKENCGLSALGNNRGEFFSFSNRLTSDGIDDFKSGNVTQQEAYRGFFILANNVINAPGCRVDEFGYVTRCVTQQEYFAAQEAIMTSSEALNDTPYLFEGGCSGERLTKYVANLATYIRSTGSVYSLPPSPVVEDFWTYIDIAPVDPYGITWFSRTVSANSRSDVDRSGDGARGRGR